MKTITSLVIVVCLTLGCTGIMFAAEPGVTDTEVVIGSSLVLEGPASYIGIQTYHGMDAYFKQVNDNGGVNGRKIKLIVYNDGYEPVPCVQNTLKLINNDKVFALASYVGTPTSVKAQPVWTNAKVPVVGFFTGAEALRTPFSRYNIHVRASYYQETEAIVDVFVKELKFKKVAVFYQYDGFGEAVKKGAEIALKKHGLTPVAYSSFERNTLNIEDGLGKIKDSNPDAIVMVGTYAPLAKFVKEAKKAGLTNTLFYTVSFVGPEAFAKELGNETAKCLMTQVVPPYAADSKTPIAIDYNNTITKYYPADIHNFVSFEGFVNSRVVVEGLKRAGKDLTREKFIDAIESIKPGEMGTGLTFSYGPNDHVGITKIYITQIINGKFVEVSDWLPFKTE